MNSVTLFLFTVLFSFSLNAYVGKKESLLLSSEDAEITGGDKENQSIRLLKNVQVVFNGQHLSADEALIKTKTKKLWAKGNVQLISQSAQIEAEEIDFNYETNLGDIKVGFLQIGQVQITGQQIKKIGPETYEFENGTFTACNTCPPAWSFSGTKVVAENGGYTKITSALMKAGGVPVLWLPYLIVPLKSERQSGLLVPNFGYSDGGGGIISQSYFWAIAPHKDATFTLKHYGRRGFKGLTEYRYLASENSGGKFFGAYINDTNAARKRWQLQYGHSFELPNNFNQRIDLNLVSDIKYPLDFNDEIKGRGDPALENRVSLTRNTDWFHSSLDADYYINLLNKGPLSDNQEAVHRFPEIRWSVAPTSLFFKNLFWSVDVNYVNFARSTFTYDDRRANGTIYSDSSGNPIRDGVFNPSTDLIRTGQRFSIKPRISYPFTLYKKFDFVPSVSFDETHYQFPLSATNSQDLGYLRSAERRFMRTEISARTKYGRVFYEDSIQDLYRYKHEIQPEISFTSVPWQYTSSHPFFGPTDSEPFFKSGSAVTDSDNIQFDYYDRLYEKRLGTFSITNRIIRKKLDNSDTPDYRQIVSLKLSQSYDLYELERRSSEPKQPWSDISALLDVRLDNFETNSLVRYFPYQNIASTFSRLKFFTDAGEFLQFNYSYDFQFTKEERNVTNRTEDLITSVGTKMKYLTLSLTTEHSLLTKRLQAFSYDLNLRPPGNCWGFQFSQRFPLVGDPSYSFNFYFLFDGKTETGFSKI